MRRKLGALAAAAAASTALVVLPVSPADAHGGLTYPATRTYACYVDGLAHGGGDLHPTNPACIAAIEAGGRQPLWDWFGNLLPDVGDRHRQVVPDGRLCGPGPAYEPYNMARTDWPTTDLRAGETITMRYNAWAAHPGTWYQYVTRDGWDPTQPLGWDDLEAEPFDVVTNPPIDGSGPHGAEYTWRATLPEGKQGRHLIFSIWERSDSPEAFYNCSDVNFVGAGAPTTPAPPPTEPPATPPTTEPPATPPTTEPPSTPPPATPPSTPPAGDASCRVDVELVSSWPGGYLVNMTVANDGGSRIGGWDVGLRLPSGSSVAHLWGGHHSQDGADVRVGAESWNAELAPGATASAGFVGAGSPPQQPSGTCTPAGGPGGHGHH